MESVRPTEPLLKTHQFEWVDRSRRCLRVWAPAKINLNLLVGPARADGFHPLDSYVLKISLYDQIDLTGRTDGRITLDCDRSDCGAVEKNLAYQAARLISVGRTGCGADIILRKNIPPGAGLGGGSSDAAAVLAGLNILWELELDTDKLIWLAGKLGSDMPLFLGPPSARMTGRGERLEPVEVSPLAALVCLSGLVCPTRDVYRAFDSTPSPMPVQLPAGELAGRPVSAWAKRLVNQLSTPTRSVCPGLANIWDQLAGWFDRPVHMTGSGSGLFVLFDSADQARDFFNKKGLPGDLTRGSDLRFHIVLPNPW